MKPNKATDALLGVATGGALGVPYEFHSREKVGRDTARQGSRMSGLLLWPGERILLR